jgi:uncharacterized protein YlxW (UPF0749 family)
VPFRWDGGFGYLAPPFPLDTIEEPAMPRISQDQTQERHAFLLDLFRSQPDVSRQEALDTFKEKFGSTINLKTLNELREQAQSEQSSVREADEPSSDDNEEENEAPAEDAASRLKAAATGNEGGNGLAQPAAPKAAKPAKGGKQKNVFVDASKEQLDFLQRIVGQLQEAGASNIRIDHATDRWMVVVVDAK